MKTDLFLLANKYDNTRYYINDIGIVSPVLIETFIETMKYNYYRSNRQDHKGELVFYENDPKGLLMAEAAYYVNLEILKKFLEKEKFTGSLNWYLIYENQNV